MVVYWIEVSKFGQLVMTNGSYFEEGYLQRLPHAFSVCVLCPPLCQVSMWPTMLGAP